MATLWLGGQTFTVRATVASLARARASGTDMLGSPADIMSAIQDPERVVAATYAIVQPQGITPGQWAEWFDSDTTIIAAQKALFEALADFSTAHGPLLRSMGQKMEQVHAEIRGQSQELATQIQTAPIELFASGNTSTSLPDHQASTQTTSNSGNSRSLRNAEPVPHGHTQPI